MPPASSGLRSIQAPGCPELLEAHLANAFALAVEASREHQNADAHRAYYGAFRVDQAPVSVEDGEWKCCTEWKFLGRDTLQFVHDCLRELDRAYGCLFGIWRGSLYHEVCRAQHAMAGERKCGRVFGRRPMTFG